jgi:outer membrane protein OmpA-like peptidoglycan-associated protein
MKRALLAATLLAAVPGALPPAARAQPIQGLYVGAGGGANFLENERVRSITIGGQPQGGGGSVSFDAGWAALGSVGWGFGNGVRVELEGSWRHNDTDHGNAPFGVSATGQESKYGAMTNVLFDMDIGSPYVFPYLGAGAGAQWVHQKRSIAGPGPIVTAIDDTAGASFAYQAIAGAAFPVQGVPGLSVTAEYRYLGLAGKPRLTGTSSAPGFGPVAATVTTSDDNNHSLLLGLRYAFDVPPPPPPPAAAPAPVAAPAPAPTRSYLVFFDWDSAALTGRARQIIAEAAQNTTRVQVTRIEVAGHADRSGTPAYNLALSRRRAEAVAAALVQQGVARQAIDIQAFGETKPLVPSAAGVREPQNRRVEIVLR